MFRRMLRYVPFLRQFYRYLFRVQSEFRQRRRFKAFWEFRESQILRNLSREGKLLDHLSPHDRAIWAKRIRDVAGDPANARIPRHRNAGRIIGRYLVMHNGLKVHPLGYYGRENLRLMENNRGVHEPEEESIFGAVLNHIRSGGVMLELGCYWAFYSMWFQRTVPGGRCFLVEPSENYLDSGRRNFAVNGCSGQFVKAMAGAKTGVQDGCDVVTVDQMAAMFSLDTIDILHSDIQGAEADMPIGCHSMLESKAIRLIFISTHSNGLHERCLAHLREYDYAVLRDTNLDRTSSHDGLIVACSSVDGANGELAKVIASA